MTEFSNPTGRRGSLLRWFPWSGGRFEGELLVVSRPVARRLGSRVHPGRLKTEATGERTAAWRTIACWWAGSRLCVLTAAIAVQSLGWPQRAWYTSTLHHPFALLGAWDGRWYRVIATRGYLPIPGHQSDTAFFPFFPLLLRLGRFLGLSLNETGMIVANLCLLAALLALYELNRCWLDEPTARRVAIYAAIFPVGYVFSMVYPESVVLAAMALAGVLAVRGRWTAAAVAAAVAALARPEALLLIMPLSALAVRGWRTADEGARARSLAAVLAAPAALAGVCVYDWRTFHDPFAFSSAERAWGRAVSPDGVWQAAVRLTRAPGTTNVWLFRDAAFCVLYLGLLVFALRAGVPRSWVFASTLVVLLPLWSGSFTSDARFGLLAPSVYSGLAWAARRRRVDIALRVSCLALLAAGTATILLRWP